MEKRFAKILCTFAMLFIALSTSAQYRLTSPNEKVVVVVDIERHKPYGSKFMKPYRMTMSIDYQRKSVLKKSEMNLKIKSHGKRYSLGKANITNIANDEAYTDSMQIYDGSTPYFFGKYRSLTIQTDKGVEVEVRAYNEGVAYRYRILGYDTYKILDISKTFPEDAPAAILGTYSGDRTLLWSEMRVDGNIRQVPVQKRYRTRLTVSDGRIYSTSSSFHQDSYNVKELLPSNGIIPWRDALSILSFGANASKYEGGAWRDVGLDWGASADFIYKYIYAGISYSPCYQILYLHKFQSYYPFDEMDCGMVYSQTFTGRLGFSLPIQYGYNIWNVSPYLSMTYFNLHQHDTYIYGATKMAPRHYAPKGLGIKINWTLRDRASFGIGYECQYFSSRDAADKRHVFSMMVGYMF